jgi:prepilin peptidase CpaA
LSLLLIAVVAAFPVVVTLAACYDLLTMTIPNYMSAILIVSFGLLALLLAPGWSVFGWHLAVGFGVLVLTFSLFAFRLIGGGDAKLAAAIALWMGPTAMAEFLVYTALFGGALSIAILAFRTFPLPLFAMKHDWITRLHAPKGEIPYGIALAAGAMMVFPETAWYRALAV